MNSSTTPTQDAGKNTNQDTNPKTQDPTQDIPIDPIAELLTTYTELNSSTITELSSVPSALEFMRFVALNRPFVVRGGASEWEATRTWDVRLLKELLRGEVVKVAITPLGNADSPTKNQDGKLVFVKPLEEDQDFTTCIDFIANQETPKSKSSPPPTEIRYCQTQNDNLRNEYSTLFTHVSPSPSFARLALQQDPEAINLWIGNSHSTTALHKDNYENIYVQVIGQKDFVLLPPIAYPVVSETALDSYTYVRTGDGGGLEMRMDAESGGNEVVGKVPFATWDPDVSPGVEGEEIEGGEYGDLVQQMIVRVTLDPGDMLYLPTQWYHKVSQRCSEEGICCAVNYWYDMEFGGSFYPLVNFVRGVSLQGKGRIDGL